MRRRPPVTRMLVGVKRSTGRRRRVCRLFYVDTESSVAADRAVAWWARWHGVENPRIFRKRFHWTLDPEMRRKRWTRLLAPDPEAWADRRAGR